MVFLNVFSVTPNRLALAVLGGGLGVRVAGAVYGVIAARLDIHRHLHNMDPTGQAASQTMKHTTPLQRSEPK